MSGSLETVALAGNPNAGKTTLFNALTGANQRTGNYAGVTVDRKSGEMFTPHGKKLRLVDLPGCYSLDGGSPDQEIARKTLLGEIEGEARPDLVVCVVDSSNLERHLVLTLQVIETGLPVVIALNMVDVAEKAGLRLDPAKLSEELGGVPVVPIQANANKGIVELKQALRHPFPHPADTPWKSGLDETLADRRLAHVIQTCEVAARRPDGHSSTLSDKIDRFALHPVFGWIVFAAVMFCVFWTIFSIADVPIGWIEDGTGAVKEWLTGKMPDGDLRSLLVDGIVAGVGEGVLVFLPQIIMLFFFIGLLESSGYMARAAFLMDGVMAKAGLSGKAFLPLLSSFACALPGIMATRTIDSAKERLTTIFVAPWMSCSARLPVYLTLVPLLLVGMTSLQQALIFSAIYVLGAVTALVVARILRGRLGEDATPSHFLLELPPYRAPQWSYIFRHIAGRAGAFLKNAGTIILAICIILWALSTYPKSDSEDPAEVLAHSAMGRISAVVEPLVKPLGFDGRTGTAIMTSFAAREVFTSTMGQLYHVEESEDEDENYSRIQNALAAATWPDGSKMFTLPALLALIVFYMYALQCLPTTAVVAREAGSWKWAIGQFMFMSAFAWLAAFAVFQIGSLL
ncbi:ferrous iron transport protein B [Luteolibacter sp. GHJ8]|uniref:Ferrous iron transport protein B n=1 Tax=Luteolibacter rhizosphaerae TaxID=2989719 RepID=A0ABT3G895_9BACT|nr:ferrous iron transport protein B [Luteolibacter rhizosphaerae]MCW1916073.1 ferrous iron transport protein B [Luteolibacter rhizosphaerae]